MRRFATLPLFLLLVLSVGCSRVNYEDTLTVGAGDVKAKIITAKSEQKVTITVTSTDAPVNVHVMLESEHKAAMDKLTNYQKPDSAKLLASKDGVREETFEVTVPRGEFAIVLSGAAKTTTVKVKAKG